MCDHIKGTKRKLDVDETDEETDSDDNFHEEENNEENSDENNEGNSDKNTAEENVPPRTSRMVKTNTKGLSSIHAFKIVKSDQNGENTCTLILYNFF